MKCTSSIAKFLTALTLGMAASCTLAQTDTSATSPGPCPRNAGPVTTTTFHLNTNSTVNQDGNDLLVALRNMLCPADKIYLVSTQSAIVMQASPDELALAQKLITELDRPRKAYRLTYTITELDGGKTIGTQHYAMMMVTGQLTTLKEGDKIPVATGTYNPGTHDSTSNETQFTYLDVGMNFSAQLDESAENVRLQSKVEQSSAGQSALIAGVQEPIVRQTVLQGTAFLTLGKPVMLGSFDDPSSTRSFDIAVVLEQVK